MDRNEGDLKILLKMKSLTGRRLMIFVESVWLSMELMEEIFRLLSSARKCSPRNVDNLMPQHPRRQGRRQSRQLIEGLGMLLSDLLGVGGYDDYQPSIPDNIAMSLYGEWPWQGRQLTTLSSELSSPGSRRLIYWVELSWRQVSVRQFDGFGYLHKCGAAVISQSWVVTAAHCLLTTPPDDLVLELGDWDSHDVQLEVEPSQTRTITHYVMHPKYSFSHKSV